MDLQNHKSGSATVPSFNLKMLCSPSLYTHAKMQAIDIEEDHLDLT